MTGLAPEPVDRAIARILAGGLHDWRDITDTITEPLTTSRGRTRQEPRDNHREATGPSHRPDAD